MDSLLSKYSPKFGFDLNYFVKGGVWLSLGQGFNLLKSFILSIVFANILSVGVFGEYSFIMSILGIAGIFALPGMKNAVIQATAKGYDGTYFKAIKQIFNWSWLGSLFLLIFSTYEYCIGSFDMALIFLIVASILPIYSISGFYSAFLNGKKKFNIFVKLSSLFNIISTIFIVLAVFLTQKAFWVVIVTLSIQILVQGFYSLIYMKKFIKNKKVDIEGIKFGKLTSLSMGFSNIAFRLDNIVVALLLGYEELAIFIIVTAIPNQLKALMNTFTPMMLPKLAAHKKFNSKQVNVLFRKLLFYTSFAIILYIFIAPTIFNVFYPKYSAYIFLSILFNISLLTFANTIFNVNLIRLKKHKIINRINIISSTYLIIGSCVFIYFFGIVGAVINRIIYRGVITGLNIYFNKKLEKY